MFFNYKQPESTAEATDIWHKLIPGAAISLQVMLESFLSATYGSETCSGKIEGVFRTIAFLLSWTLVSSVPMDPRGNVRDNWPRCFASGCSLWWDQKVCVMRLFVELAGRFDYL